MKIKASLTTLQPLKSIQHLEPILKTKEQNLGDQMASTLSNSPIDKCDIAKIALARWIHCLEEKSVASGVELPTSFQERSRYPQDLINASYNTKIALARWNWN